MRLRCLGAGHRDCTNSDIGEPFLWNAGRQRVPPAWISRQLSGPAARPPYRAIGFSYTYRTYVFQVSQGIALYRPNLPYRSRGEGVAGGIAAQAALWGISRYTGGILEIVSPIVA